MSNIEELSNLINNLENKEKEELFKKITGLEKFMLKGKREEISAYYKNKYNNNPEWKQKHLERQRKYYYNRKEKLKKMSNNDIENE